MNNLGSKIGNVLKQGGRGADRGMSRAIFKGGGKLNWWTRFAKTAIGALKICRACWSNCNCV